MRTIAILSLLAACGEPELTISFDAPLCEAEGEAESDSFTVVAVDEETILASRDAVTQSCSARFVPVVEAERGLVRVWEYWEEGAQSSCTACFSPTVELGPFSEREIEIHWFEGDADLPEHVAEVPLR